MHHLIRNAPLSFVSLAFLLLSPLSHGAPKQATNNNSLDDGYFAHDLYEINDGRQELGRGFRNFNANGVMTRLFTFPASTPLDYEVASDATYRIFSSTFDGGFAGSIGLGGNLAVFTQESPANADAQVRAGYASLQISVKQSSSRRDSDFNGTYSYHGLLRRANDAYQTSFGVATANGQGDYFVIRESTVARAFSYNVESDGRIDLGRQEPGDAAIAVGGDLIVNTADLGSGDDDEIPGGYTGLVMYLRRFPDNDATTADFRGSYRIHELTANGSSTPAADLGLVTAGGNGYFFGTLGGAEYGGQILLNSTGTFSFAGSNNFQGTLGANGDVAIVTSKGATTPSLALWIRVAGGMGNALDSDGDGLTNAEEAAMNTNPNLADSDGDGLLDNADARPTVADNIVVATLSKNTLTFTANDPTSANITLNLDSNDFPFFEWNIASSVPWLTLDETVGMGDGDITARVNVATLNDSDSPFRAEITLTAPAMAPVAPIVLTVVLADQPVALEALPETLHFTVAENGVAPNQNLALSSPDEDDFSWTVSNVPPWLTLSPLSGTGATNIQCTLDADTLTTVDSPYEATLTFTANASQANQIGVLVTVEVLPPRDMDVPFPVQMSNNAQTQPSVAFDSARNLWVMSWVEEGQIRAMFLDDGLIPLTAPVQLSITALGIASNPTTIMVEDADQAWVIWEQRDGSASDGIIQAQALNLGDRSLASRFGFSSSIGDKSMPSATYSRDTGDVMLVFNQEFEGESFLSYVLVDGSTRTERSQGFAVPNNNHQSRPAVAWLADSSTYLLVWREIVPGDGEGSSVQIRAARLDGVTGAPMGDVLVLDDNAPNADHLRVAAAPGVRRWVVLWSETPVAGIPARLEGSSVSDSGVVGTRYLIDGFQRATLPVALGYNEESKLMTAIWSRSPDVGNDVGVYQHLAGTGQPLGTPVALPDAPMSVSTAAVGANPNLNEFLLVWEAPGTIPRQLRALRISGGSGDVDEDGLPNEWELEFGLDPSNPAGDDGADGDPDHDGLTNLAEFQLGTDPTDPDSDDDGLFDGQEDTNSDGMISGRETSPLESDSDNDGVTDDVEWFLSSNGADENSTPDSGIYRIEYGSWIPGEPGSLTVSFYVAAAGTYGIQVNPDAGGLQNAPEDWTLSSDDSGTGQMLESGVHSIGYTITPSPAVTPTTAYGSFRFVLEDGTDTLDRRTTLLVAEVLPAYSGTDALAAESLAKAHAPVLRLHRDAVFTPIPVDLSLSTATFDMGNTMTLTVAPAPFDLGQSPYTEAFVDLPGDDTDALFAAYPDFDARPNPVTYYTIAKLGNRSVEDGAPSNHIAIQYYFHFYADVWGLDQSGGHRHEGDWEVFQVLLDDTGVAYRGTATQQWQLADQDGAVPGGESRLWENIELAPDKRPILYVSQGSHALHFDPGTTAYTTGTEVHDGQGFWMVPTTEAEALIELDYDQQLPMTLTPLGRLSEEDPTPWLAFAGRWGQANFPIPDTDAANPPVNDGPVGPAFLGTTLVGNSSTGVPRIWSDPYAFAERMPDATNAAMALVRGTIPEPLRSAQVLLLGPRGRIYFGDIDALSGDFALSVPVSDYALALVTQDDADGRPTLAAAVYFQVGSISTPLFPATEGTTELGSFELVEGALVSSGNYRQIDSDGDGMMDNEDDDIDGDGIANEDDGDMRGDGWLDTFQAQDPDGDGIPSFLDPDDDGDMIVDGEDGDRDGNGILDTEDPGDRDRDGFYDVLDLDIDNDGYPNAVEEEAGSDPRHFLDTPLRQAGDLDGDGKVDAADGQSLVNQALGRAPYQIRSDYNLDGVIDATDLQSLINDILRMAP